MPSMGFAGSVRGVRGPYSPVAPSFLPLWGARALGTSSHEDRLSSS
jgi:hypothetical protein